MYKYILKIYIREIIIFQKTFKILSRTNIELIQNNSILYVDLYIDQNISHHRTFVYF